MTPTTIANKRKGTEHTSNERPPAKQPKIVAETDDEAFEFINYIYIRKKDPPKPRNHAPAGQSNGKINFDLYIEKGPFAFSSGQMFEDYLTMIAATLQCYKSKLILNELKYKQKVPQTSQAHSLTSELAFAAMVEDMRAAKTAAKRIMYILSPAPMRPNSDEAVSVLSILSSFLQHSCSGGRRLMKMERNQHLLALISRSLTGRVLKILSHHKGYDLRLYANCNGLKSVS